MQISSRIGPHKKQCSANNVCQTAAVERHLQGQSIGKQCSLVISSAKLALPTHSLQWAQTVCAVSMDWGRHCCTAAMHKQSAIY